MFQESFRSSIFFCAIELLKILQWQRWCQSQSGASHSHISQPVNFKSVFWIQRSFSISPCLRLGKMCHRRPTSRAPGIPAHVPKLHPQVTEPQKIQFVICTDIKFCMRFPHTYSIAQHIHWVPHCLKRSAFRFNRDNFL